MAHKNEDNIFPEFVDQDLWLLSTGMGVVPFVRTKPKTDKLITNKVLHAIRWSKLFSLRLKAPVKEIGFSWLQNGLEVLPQYRYGGYP